MGSEYGYVRVSAKDQNADRQVLAMHEFGIEDHNIVIDKQSGKDFDRPGYRRLIEKVKTGDVIVIKSIDRLGRNYDEILEQWRIVTKVKRVDIVVIDMPLLDTRSNGRNLTQTFVADMVLQILSYVAQTEREAIKQRQKEGIEAARAKGVKFGRKPIGLPEMFYAVAQRCSDGDISIHRGAEILEMPYSTFLKKYKLLYSEQGC